MGILLIECTSKKIEFGYSVDSEKVISNELSTDDNADTLAYYIKEFFVKNGFKFTDIETVSLSNGPGSFTGLRIGSAIAKGVCYSTGAGFIELSTLDIIANKYKTDKKIISFIVSNPRLAEFYYCEYLFDGNKLNRISDYNTGTIDTILTGDSIFVMNESAKQNFPKEFSERLKDVSGFSNIPSQLELTNYKILENDFSDYRTSKPFYMKEFVPKI